MLLVTVGSPFVFDELIVTHFSWVVNCFIAKIGHPLFILSVFAVDAYQRLCYNVSETEVRVKHATVYQKEPLDASFDATYRHRNYGDGDRF